MFFKMLVCSKINYCLCLFVCFLEISLYFVIGSNLICRKHETRSLNWLLSLVSRYVKSSRAEFVIQKEVLRIFQLFLHVSEWPWVNRSKFRWNWRLAPVFIPLNVDIFCSVSFDLHPISRQWVLISIDILTHRTFVVQEFPFRKSQWYLSFYCFPT